RRVKLLAFSTRRGEADWFDLTPALGGQAGNVFVNASASATVRLGYNLPTHFINSIKSVPLSLPLRRPLGDFSTQSVRAAQPASKANWDAYVYFVANASYVARNVFLDANDDTHRIERRPTVRPQRAGPSFRRSHC